MTDLPHPFISYFRKQCSTEPLIEKAILFGSRARGDSVKVSDFDIAVVAPELPEATWIRFISHIRETAPTLCQLDILKLNDGVREELRRHILDEGVTIYERR